MNYLEVSSSCTIVQLRQSLQQNSSLDEQVTRFLSQNPFLLLEVSGIQFGSMNIGELLNLTTAFDGIWGNTLHRIGMLNLSETGQTIFSKTGLSGQFPNFDSVAAALQVFTHG